MRMRNAFVKAADIPSEYARKAMPASEVVKVVKKGHRIHIGCDASVCKDFEAALAGRASELEDVTIISTNTFLPDSYQTVKADPSGKAFRIHSTHMSKKDRVANKAGHAWFIPNLFHQGPRNFAEFGRLNIAVVMTGPMDKFGNFNFGVTPTENVGIIENADIIIVEANKQMPNCFGIENYINLADVDFIIESDYPLPELPDVKPKDSDIKIAEHIMPLIEDGSCLQLGIGGTPNYLGEMIAKSDLGNFSVHTEMMCDSFVDLYEAGKITGRKNTNPGKMVYTLALGTKKLYDFIDDNPVCLSAPVSYVNNMSVVGANDKMVSINSCLQVDIYGQVNSESAGHLHISGTGGQLDYVEGAYLSKGGKSFLCTASTKTFKDGTVESLILPALPPGSIVTCPRAAVDYIVTEYGAVQLKGKSTWERAEALVSIAHPDFRDELIKAAERQGVWKNSSKLL